MDKIIIKINSNNYGIHYALKPPQKIPTNPLKTDRPGLFSHLQFTSYSSAFCNCRTELPSSPGARLQDH